MVTTSQERFVPLTAKEQYMREVRQISQLSDEEAAHLLLCIERGENVKQSRDRLIEGYQPLVIGLAKRYIRYCQHVELLDLVQEGNLGLFQALDKYDRTLCGSSFVVWAFSWIRGMMLTALWQHEGAIRIPLKKARAIREMNTVNARLLAQLHREPTIAETAQEMKLAEQDVRELIVLQEQHVVSISTYSLDDEDVSLEDILPDTSYTPSLPVSSALEKALAALTERERLVVRLRFGFDDGQARTQREVAHLLNVALSTVATIDRKAQMRLRKALSA